LVSDDIWSSSRRRTLPEDRRARDTSHTFAQQIEELVWTTNVSYMEAVLLWCDKRGLEPEVGAELVRKSAPLKGKIQCEAEELRFLKPSGAKLPI
jgi:hypothetical protein